MSYTLIAQIPSIIAGICMLLSLSKDKEEALKLQSFDCVANALADVLLGGWVGVVLCIAGIVRNMHKSIEEQLKIKINPMVLNVIAWSIALVVGLLTKDFILVILFEVVYTVALFKFTETQSKVILAINLLTWFIYDLGILSLGMAIVDLIVFVKMIFDIYNNAPDENIVRMSIKGSETVKPFNFLQDIKNAADEIHKSDGTEEQDDIIDFNFGGEEQKDTDASVAESNEQKVEKGEHGLNSGKPADTVVASELPDDTSSPDSGFKVTGKSNKSSASLDEIPEAVTTSIENLDNFSVEDLLNFEDSK